MGVYQRPDSPYWWLRLETNNQRIATEFKIGTTSTERRDSRALADALYHQRMNDLAARLYKLPTAQAAIRFTRYAETYATTVVVHHKGARRELEMLDQLDAFFGGDLLTALDRERVQAYMSYRRAKGVAAVTVNREIDLLKAMLRDATPKYLTASPIAGMPRLKILKPQRRLMTRTEERKLLAVCQDPQDRAIFILGLDTLIRLGDLLDLERRHRTGVWLYVQDPKGGEPYEAALSKRAAKALDAIKHDKPFYFEKFRRAENPRDWPGSVRQRFEFLCREANLPYGRSKHGLTFHWATRRTGATRLVMDDRQPIPAVQKQGNWKTADVLLSIYTEATKADQLRAVGQSAKRKRA